MDIYRELAERLRQTTGSRPVALTQGIITQVDGLLCRVRIGTLEVPGVRLRASETEQGGQLLVTPKVGTAVIVGSLTGDLSQLVVLHADCAESIVMGGGALGGLVNIAELTARLNSLVDAFNRHTHQVTVSHPGGTFTTMQPAQGAERFNRGDYEDSRVTH